MEVSCSHYSNKQKILLVGEGDFSFSLSLAKAFGSATNITATSLNTREELERNYKDAKENVEELVRLGCKVVHGVNVHSMHVDYRLCSRLYDVIVFNFPHAGFDFGPESSSHTIMKHQELVSGFMRSARKMVKDGVGEIHVTHKMGFPFYLWNILTLGEKEDLCCDRTLSFDISLFPGYSNKYGSGKHWDLSFPLRNACTFIFRK